MLENIQKENSVVETEETSKQQPEVNSKGPRNPKGKPDFSKRPPRSKTGSDSGFEEKVVSIKRISKTTKGGRHMRFSALVVIGDKKGSVGYGLGKSVEVPNAIKKAIKNAKNNLTKVILTKKASIYHDVIGKACAAKVLLKPAKPGTGIIAGGAIRAVVELAGYTDIYTKNLGKNTSANMIQATINGLLSQMTPEQIASARDKQVSEL